MMTPEQLSARLKPLTELPKVVFCCGEEPQRALASIDAIKQKAKHLGFLEQQLLVVEQASDWEWVWMHYQEQSLFANLRLMQVVFTGKLTTNQSETLQQHLANPNPDVLLLLRTGEVDKYTLDAKWVKAIDAIGWVIHSKTLTGNALNQWIAQEVESLQMTISSTALSLLADWSQGNLMATKQSLLRWQLEGKLHLDEVLLTQDQQDWARYDVFALSNAIASQQVEFALRILQRLRETGEELVLLLWAVSKELRLWQSLWAAHTQKPWSQLSNELRLYGDRSTKLQRLIQHLSMAKLLSWQALALQIDAQIKGQQSGDPWAEFMWLVADMASGGKKLPARLVCR